MNKILFSKIKKYVKLYESYRKLIDKFVYNLCEYFTFSYFSPNILKSKDILESITENVYNRVKKGYGVSVIDLLNENKKFKAYDDLILIENIYHSLNNSFNTNNIFLILEGNNILKENIEKLEKYISKTLCENIDIIKDIQLIENSEENASLIDIKNSISEILNELKKEMIACNNSNDNINNLISCQVKTLDNTIDKLKSLLNSCSDNEECKINILKYISKLEQNKKELHDII